MAPRKNKRFRSFAAIRVEAIPDRSDAIDAIEVWRMESEKVVKKETLLGMADGCQCDAAGSVKAEESTTCDALRDIITEEEQRILDRIRVIHQQAQNLKEEIQRLAGDVSGNQEAVVKLRQALEKLKKEREELEGQRIAAAHERMRRLGHV